MEGWELSPVRLQEAIRLIHEETRAFDGIGTLSEKSVHAALKYALQPYADSREVRVGRYVADIVGEHGIIEIQSSSFSKLRGKLEAFLPVCPVTVVWPCAETTWLTSIDPETGEVKSSRRSPRHHHPSDIVRELYSIRDLLGEDGLHFKIISLEVEELRTATKTRKKGRRWASVDKLDRLPLQMLGQISIDSPDDLGRLYTLSEPLSECFTVRDFASASSLDADTVRLLLKVMAAVGQVSEVGKKGNSRLYRLETEKL